MAWRARGQRLHHPDDDGALARDGARALASLGRPEDVTPVLLTAGQDSRENDTELIRYFDEAELNAEFARCFRGHLGGRANDPLVEKFLDFADIRLPSENLPVGGT